MELVARFTTRIVQSGYLRYYVALVLAATVGLVGYTLFRFHGLRFSLAITEIRSYELIMGFIILGATWSAARATSRLAAVASLGVVGFGVSILFIFFEAPDLAMTQISIETLTVVLLVLILYRLPRFSSFTSRATHIRDSIIALVSRATHIRDSIIALVSGALMTLSQDEDTETS